MTTLLVTLIMLWTTPGYSKPGEIMDSTPNTEAQCHARAAEWIRLLTPDERKTVHYECRP